ncbi:hypothetical protein K4K61_006620 [Colletotrichum sp. SAR11_59]|uniref:Uncharacterized protein n=1 Tax=Colletotrichum asianum TaxID=702518 RepID=A0A8H3ZEY8_9PEZI|nr:hypothetical protein GQ607_016159 [Colletotrichum asianum]KAI8303894.1 hypothetical protein K4K61_006620 [Colletotrichum sp. SAR11_59]
MANAIHSFGSGSVRSLFLWFLLHVLLINASPTPRDTIVLTKRARAPFPTFAQDYDGRVQKGQYLNDLFPLDDAKAAEYNGGASVASPYQDPSVLKPNGWTRYIFWYPFEQDSGDVEAPFGAVTDPAFDNMGLSIDKTPGYDNNLDNAFADTDHPVDETEAGEYYYRHDREFGQGKKPTMASYSNVLVPASGAFIFDEDYSPSFRKSDWGLGDVPDLDTMSDVAFFQWIDACKAKNIQPNTLKLIFVSHCTNQKTYDIVVEALKATKYNKVPSYADKAVFGMDTPEGQAILGTVWGSATSWMLIQHKKELGLKKIKEVAIWGLGNGFAFEEEPEGEVANLNMRFVVEDA